MLFQLDISNANGFNPSLLQVCIALLIVLIVVPVYAVCLQCNAPMRQIKVNRIGMDRVFLHILYVQIVKRLSDLALYAGFATVALFAQARTKARGALSRSEHRKRTAALIAGKRDLMHLCSIVARFRAIAGAAYMRLFVNERPAAVLTGGFNSRALTERSTTQRAIDRIAVMSLRLLVKDGAALWTCALGGCFPRGMVAGIATKQPTRATRKRLPTMLTNICLKWKRHNRTSLTRGSDIGGWGKLVSVTSGSKWFMRPLLSLPYYTTFGITVLRKALGDGRHEITQWTLGLDASYTPMPAGGLLVNAGAMKSLLDEAGIDLISALYIDDDNQEAGSLKSAKADGREADDERTRALLLELDLLTLETQ